MEKKSNEILPGILIRNYSHFTVNSSLNGTFVSLIDFNEVNTRYYEDNEVYDGNFEYTHDEEAEEILTSVHDLDDCIKESTVQTVSIIKRNILKEFKNYEILAFDIQGDDRIIFFIKTINEENKEKFLLLILSLDFYIDMKLLLSSIVELEHFRAYGPFHSGCYEFHMKDSLLEYEFELLTYKNLNTLSRYLIPIIEVDLRKQNEGIYFVIKNNLGDHIIVKHLTYPDDVTIFNKVLTKADPQAGLLFSLSYNANK